MENASFFAYICFIVILKFQYIVGNTNNCECVGTFAVNALLREMFELKTQNEKLTARIDRLEITNRNKPSMSVDQDTRQLEDADTSGYDITIADATETAENALRLSNLAIKAISSEKENRLHTELMMETDLSAFNKTLNNIVITVDNKFTKHVQSMEEKIRNLEQNVLESTRDVVKESEAITKEDLSMLKASFKNITILTNEHVKTMSENMQNFEQNISDTLANAKEETKSVSETLQERLAHNLTSFRSELDKINQEVISLIADVSTISGYPKQTGKGQVKGYHFGFPGSRLEYDSLSMRIRSVMSLEFRTEEPSGVIFYVSDIRLSDHISVTVKEGRIRFSFDCGSGTAEIKSTGIYNNGRWHKLEFIRNMREGSLEVDDEFLGKVESPGRARSVNVRDPYYIGGINQAYISNRDVTNLDGVTNSFNGCIANVSVNGKDIGIGEFVKQIQVQPCIEPIA